MGTCPEMMERWGTASIFKESVRLLHKHYRLFLPFFLAFYLPISIAAVFETMFLLPSSTPLLDDVVVTGSVNTAQTTDPPGGPSFTTIFSWTLFFLVQVFETLGTIAVSYITAYLYSPINTDDVLLLLGLDRPTLIDLQHLAEASILMLLLCKSMKLEWSRIIF